MKVLVVGGAHQGKRTYVHDTYGDITVDALHLEVRRRMERGREAKAELLAELDAAGDWTAVCDEVGCGVVPVEAFERQWREETGRLCCELARRADIVERVTMGIPLRLKG